MSIVCCREKAVLVAVYAENPRKRLIPSPRRSHHHHHHHHHIHVLNGGDQPRKSTVTRGRGYNRRADLLEYARHLRASARPTTLATSTSVRRSTSVKRSVSVKRSPSVSRAKRSPSVSRAKQSPPVQIVPVKPKEGVISPACFGKWECLMPGFLRIMTASRIAKDKDRRKNKDRKSLPGVTKMKVMVKNLVVQKKKGNFVSKMFGKLRKRG